MAGIWGVLSYWYPRLQIWSVLLPAVVLHSHRSPGTLNMLHCPVFNLFPWQSFLMKDEIVTGKNYVLSGRMVVSHSALLQVFLRWC